MYRLEEKMSRAEKALAKAHAEYDSLSAAYYAAKGIWTVANNKERSAYALYSKDFEDKKLRAAWLAAEAEANALYSPISYYDKTDRPNLAVKLQKAKLFVELKMRQLEDFNERQAERNAAAERRAACLTAAPPVDAAAEEAKPLAPAPSQEQEQELTPPITSSPLPLQQEEKELTQPVPVEKEETVGYEYDVVTIVIVAIIAFFIMHYTLG